jgi:hypothetical protein
MVDRGFGSAELRSARIFGRARCWLARLMSLLTRLRNPLRYPLAADGAPPTRQMEWRVD